VLPKTLLSRAARLIVWLWCNGVDSPAQGSGAQEADKAGEYEKADKLAHGCTIGMSA
jgi:hypothetical protein